MKEVSGYNPSKDPRLINCKTECGNERCFAKRYGLFAEKTCQNFTEPKLQTNADKIRSMSDEELAKYLDGVCHDLWQMFVEDPQKMWLDWLKQEANDG